MRILVTGGAGFIGQHLARALQSHELKALDVLSPQVHLDPEASRLAFPGEVLVGDVSEPDAWSGVRRWRPEVIVHLAAETGTAQSMYQTERYRRVNVEGTALAAGVARDVGAALVLASSRAVYGEGRHRSTDGTIGFGPLPPGATPEPSHEDDPHHPVSFYGQTKSEAEQAASAVSADVPVAIVRPQNVVGPGQALHNPYTGVLAAFLARLREGRALQVYGDGHQTRDLVAVDDVAAVLGWLATTPRPAGDPLVLNIGSGTRTTLVQLARWAAAGSPRPDTPVEHVAVHRAGDIEHACADLTRLRAVGAPQPQVSSEEAVTGFIRWSWDKPGASSAVWDRALDELGQVAT